MASNPPFQVEDTDEDFFDKLVNDDDDDYKINPLSEATNLADGSDFDDTKAFANLGIGDVGTGLEDIVKIGAVEEVDTKDSSSINGDIKHGSANTYLDPGRKLMSSSSFAFDSVSEETIVKTSGLEEPCDSTASWDHGSGDAPGVKEVQWNAFTTELVDNANNGFGSYNEFYTEFGDNSVEQTGKGGNLVSSQQNIVSGSSSVGDDSLQTENISYYSHQFQEVQSYATAGEQSSDGQYPNSIESWENLYPGWKYDANTGQWYQVNEGYDVAANVQGVYSLNNTSEGTVSDEKPEVSFLQQTVQSVAGAIADKGMNESVTSWNSVSQSNHSDEILSNWDQASKENYGYPSHMVFDPQYPGWYYDMNTQEWCSLDAYNSRQIVQSHDMVNQNAVSANSTYYGNDQKAYGMQDKLDNQSGFEGFSSQGRAYKSKESFNNVERQGPTTWQPDPVASSSTLPDFRGSQFAQNSHGTSFPLDNHVNQHQSFYYAETASSFTRPSQVNNEFTDVSVAQSFVSTGNFNQPFSQSMFKQSEKSVSKTYGSQNQSNYSHQPVLSGQQVSYASAAGRSSAGRPPHALVTFGFGGKLIVMKDVTAFVNPSYASQDSNGGSVSVHNLAEVFTGGATGASVCDYFDTLAMQSFPGPLAGGNVGGKELSKWIDERITQSGSSNMDYSNNEVLKLLLSLLKISLQHYGKLRSPFGADAASKENDAPEVAVARLFASVRKSSDYVHFTQCLQQLPSERETQITAAEVQALLISGRKIDALQRAQEGQLWGPALVLAAQLGDQFYVDTVRKMALCQLVAGSPLRTLCLLIAGQPADAFLTDTTKDGVIPGTVNMSQQDVQAQPGADVMLEDWEDNLAVIAANRTKDDELVLIHLGDCLWKERSNIIAAHICYVVAEANFEPYSDTARLCLIGSDHWKHPRTYASPDAIQRTEVYEYAKLLGNSQFTLLPFQPYKLLYAYMLAEVGRVSDSLKYCQSVSKSLKTVRAPELETWKQMVSSLEDRIKTHQQGGFSSNLAPGKLVGKLFNLFDSTAHRVVGGLPPPVPSTSSGNMPNDNHHHLYQHQYQLAGPRVSTSQSTMAMSSLVPSASMEPINQWSDDANKKVVHNRSVSEPDFSRSSKQVDDPSKEKSSDSQNNKVSASSRLGRLGFGTRLLQKTMDLVLKSRGDKQAKLGDANKFYYDEKLKRWVEEGVEPPGEEAALPPPPIMAATQNGPRISDNMNLNTALNGESRNRTSDFTSPMPSAHTSGVMAVTSNQFSARGRLGVRARYVDTFNQGGGNPTNLLQSPPVPTVKPSANANPKFFVPTPSSSAQQPVDPPSDNTQPAPTDGKEDFSSPSVNNTIQSLQQPSSAMGRYRFSSMDNVSEAGTANHAMPPVTRRIASWSGNEQSVSFLNRGEQKQPSSMINDDLQDVDL